jgi:RHS repeat-associated protein
MTTRTQLDQKGSLNAIWHEYLSVKVLLSNTKNAAKPNTSVGHALLNARFYDSQRGQFLSEDPVYWGAPKKQDLQNPQNLNSYSYAVDNPITTSDPTGKCILCAGLARSRPRPLS